MLACGLPYLNKYLGKADYGVSRAGCVLANEWLYLSRCLSKKPDDDQLKENAAKANEQEAFLKHFELLQYAQLLWTWSISGTIDPPRTSRWDKDEQYLEMASTNRQWVEPQ